MLIGACNPMPCPIRVFRQVVEMEDDEVSDEIELMFLKIAGPHIPHVTIVSTAMTTWRYRSTAVRFDCGCFCT